MKKLSIMLLLLCTCLAAFGQNKGTEGKKGSETKPEEDKTDIYAGLNFRSIGPALMSGRISDIAIHPQLPNTWYVGVGSGGVWKTENAGTTWKPLFDGQPVYSIGCIALDPQNPDIVWVGTGENVGGRHVSFGDGVYKSEDGGSTWKNMGLKASEHISKIVVHPTNANIVWVASQGPLWSKGGERGVYKTTDGGKAWKRVLGDDAWMGATDLLIDPRNPDLLYAAAWQRHRTVAGYIGGGPSSGIHRSFDGGETWEKMTNGLPAGNMGKIGIAISPQKPDVVYAAIELDRRKGGIYRSENQGGSWVKMSDAISGGTGPHYYQELYACPNQFDRIYLVDNFMQVSHDGGKTVTRMNENNKHIDNHAIAFKKGDPNYLLVGTDGGLYESFDRTATWKFVSNLPVTQFYKIALDDALPFYNIYGGTQDNNTQVGPSRTDNVHGIRNSDWEVVLFGDGHQPATEPGNPNIVYAEWQEGCLVRHDRNTGEMVFIQPQPALGEKAERFNWDAPILVSPHNPKQLYFASQRVWKSTDRGDTWTAISGDLTKNLDRIRLPFFESTQGWDSPWDVLAMSNFSTITSLAESPLKEGVLYAGTDDGQMQVTEDGGKNWRKIDYSALSGLPATAFVNDIKADLFDVNTVYAIFDNHKYGDLKPYIYKSTDMGKTWTSLVANLPEKGMTWRIVQDYVSKDLLFLGTEFGVYCTQDGGKKWHALKAGLPNIAVRDLAIHKRENDLVLATFGRGIYILDDYSALRNLPKEPLAEATLYKPRKAYWYLPKQILGEDPRASQGDAFFITENPPFGASFTYFLQEKYLTKAEARKKAEKDQKPAQMPAWRVLDEETNEIAPRIWLEITDASGNVINRVPASNSKGLNRVAWNLRKSSPNVVRPNEQGKAPQGVMVAPGTYSAQLFKQIDGLMTAISEKVAVEVAPLSKGFLTGSTPEATAKFWDDLQKLGAAVEALGAQIAENKGRTEAMMTAYQRANKADATLLAEIVALRKQISEMEFKLNGSKARGEIGEKDEYPGINGFLGSVSLGTTYSTYGPTPAHLQYFQNAQKLFEEIRAASDEVKASKLPALEIKLKAIGAPLMEGQRIQD